jgi:hypothetical protein
MLPIFTFDPPIPEPPVPISPTGATYTATLTPTLNTDMEFRWNAVEHGVSYTVWLGDGAGVELERQRYASSTVGCINTCVATIPVSLAAGGYHPRKAPGAFRWKVQAENGYGHASDWSQPATFAVTISPPSSITLGSAAGNPPTFNWGAVVNAAEYNLKVASTLGVVASVATEAARACDSATCTATLASTLSVGLYSWYVTAINSGGSITSDTATFTVGTATAIATTTGGLGAMETVAVLEHAEYSYTMVMGNRFSAW